MPSKNLVLRTMYIDPDVDDELRTEAFDSRTSKNDLLRKYLRLGMEAAKKDAVHKDAVKAGGLKRKPPVVVAEVKGGAKSATTPLTGKTIMPAVAGRKPASKPVSKTASKSKVAQ
jgi:hypothetical protein